MSEPSIEVSDKGQLVTDPVVSVLMLVYNHAPYLPEAIESVIAQRTDFEFELLIGEDNSTDDSRRIIEGYQRRYPEVVRLIVSARNVGMQQNLDRLVRASRAPLIAFCEGDDYWHARGKLEKQVRLMRSSPDVVAVHSEFSHITRRDGEWKRLPRFWQEHRVSIPEGDVFADLVVSNFIQTCTLMIRTDIAVDYLDSDLPAETYAVADWPLCLFASSRGRIRYLDEPLATYRHVIGSATNQGRAADVRRAKDAMRMVSDFISRFDEDAGLEERAHGLTQRHILLTGLRCGDVGSVREALQWLERHPGHASPLLLAIARMLAARPVLARSYRRAHQLRARALERSRYRAPEPASEPIRPS